MKGGSAILGYIRLSAAIVNSGIEQHDEVFLQSTWCKYLIDNVIDYHNNTHSDDGMRYHAVSYTNEGWC